MPQLYAINFYRYGLKPRLVLPLIRNTWKKVLLSNYLIGTSYPLKYSLQEITNTLEIVSSVLLSREIVQEVLFYLNLG